jgi:general secretion pathway protein D
MAVKRAYDLRICMPSSLLTAGARLPLVCVVLSVGLLASVPRASMAAPVDVAIPQAWHIHSPYTSLSRTRQILDAIGFEVLGGYAAPIGTARPGGLADRPGTQIARTFTKLLPDGATRFVEVVIAASPAGGYELYVTGSEIRDGRSEPNPDLEGIQAGIEKVATTFAPGAVQADSGPIDRRRLAYEIYQLSYIEPDRAMALMKALDYSTIEFNDTPGETLYDKIFSPNFDKDKLRLPVIIKMVAASKTSLQESTAEPPTYGFRGSDLLPDLGGIFLHRTTAAEPQNRLLIAYDPDDLVSLERVVNLLRDKVDVAARQLTLEALVIEINSDSTRDLGISWDASGTRGNNTFSGSTLKGGLLDNAPLTFLFSRATDTFNFNVALNALLEANKARILSNPSVLVLDGRQAKIQIGQRIPVVETTVTQSATTESVLYFPVGIVLNLRPRLNRDGSEVSMQVETIVSSVHNATTGGTSVTRAPEVDSRQVQTIVRVHNDTPFIIGGLTSNEETIDQRGIPFLSKIPYLGLLFQREIKEKIKQEIIIVVTPHLVPEDTKAFSYVIPQESPAFDTFGRELLYNAYRIRQQDVFNLDFLQQSDAFRGLVRCARRYVENRIAPGRTDPTLSPLLEGVVPGEEILVRRMLWEIIRKTDYARFVNLDNAIVFEQAPDKPGEPGFKVSFLAPKLAALDKERNALVLTYSASTAGTPEHPFSQPTAAVSLESLKPENFFSRLAQGNHRSASGAPESWMMLLTDSYSGTAKPLDVLKGVIVLRRLIALNPELPLSLDSFRAGRQIIFPTETELQQSHHLVDTEAARLFYEITSYYPAFEDEFKQRARSLVEYMGGCEWWGANRPVEAVPPPH